MYMNRFVSYVVDGLGARSALLAALAMPKTEKRKPGHGTLEIWSQSIIEVGDLTSSVADFEPVEVWIQTRHDFDSFCRIMGKAILPMGLLDAAGTAMLYRKKIKFTRQNKHEIDCCANIAAGRYMVLIHGRSQNGDAKGLKFEVDLKSGETVIIDLSKAKNRLFYKF